MQKRNVRSGRQTYSGGRPDRSRPTVNRPKLSPEATRVLAYFVIGFFAVYGVWQVFSVRKIVVTGNKTLATEAVTKLVNQSFDRHLLSSNLLTLSLAHLSSELPANSERIAAADIKLQWPGTIQVVITERLASLGWASGGVNYALDENGKVIGLLADLAASVAVVTDSTNLPIKTGDTVAPARFVSFCSSVVTSLPKQTGIGASSLRIADTTGELYVTTNRNYLIKFDTTRGIEEQIEDLKAVLATLVQQKKTPAEYIDLRIAGKAYWR